jgi:very-short-patch-repair endonuclease
MPSDAAAAVPSPAEPEQAQRSRKFLEAAFAAWRGRLLDLSARNRALNYRPTKVATLSIVEASPEEVYRRLVGEGQAFSFGAVLPSSPPVGDADPAERQTEPPDPSIQDFAHSQDAAAVRHLDAVLRCKATPEGLDLSLRRITELQRTSLEEQGVNSVFLALGFLHYRESTAAKEVSRAPLVLVPVTLERTTAQAGYRLLAAEDEPMVNPSLIEYLRRIHEFDSFPSIPEPGDDDESLDLAPFYAAVSTRVKDLKGWQVTPDIVLAPFTFQKLVIYKDIEQNEATFGSHALVRRVVLKEGEPAHDLPAEIRELDLDAQYPPEVTNQVVDADASQLRAIAAVAKGHDLVIHGPPGTGKSQTITNIIADTIGSGKRVLFVSEKMAALEVVHRRLVAAGLGEACLELHSTKARKADVIESLRVALERSGEPTLGTAKNAAELVRTRSHLNDYVRELHERRTALDCSCYEAVGKFAAAYNAPKFQYPDDPTALTRDQLTEVLNRIRQLEVQGAAVEPVRSKGWRDSHLTSFSEGIAERIDEALREAIDLSGQFTQQARALHDRFGVQEPTTLSNAAEPIDLAAHINESPGVPAHVLREAAWISPPEPVTELLDRGRRCSRFEARLRESYRRELLESVGADDLQYIEHRLESPFAILAFLAPRYRHVRRRLAAMRQPDCKVAITEQLADLRSVPKWRQERETLANDVNGPAWFGVAWRGATSDWNDLQNRVEWVTRFHSLVQQHGAVEEAAYQIAERGAARDLLPKRLAETVVALCEALTKVRELVAWSEDYLRDEPVPSIVTRLAELVRDRSLGASWAAFNRAVNVLADTPAAEIAAAVREGSISPDQAGRAFQRALYGNWLDAVVPTAPALANFTAEIHEDHRFRFQKLDAHSLVENRGELVSRLRELAQRRYANSSAAHRTFLHKELAKQKRHRPLRVILREAREAALALKPCFLMSPLSVSQFLMPLPDFDLVVFDEASQLPTEDAVAAICRGKKLVVVGDPKQLPPTNFFAVQTGSNTAQLDDNGEAILEETESVLEEFQGVGLHQAHLEWHYRSEHESLIQFSNEKFYGNRLVVFPSAASASPDQGIRFEFIEGGRYEGAGLNPTEARRIAEAAVEHFRKTPELSLGVGTFSQRQQMAIWDELERFRREDPSLEEHLDRAKPEPFFVKNLENIQGDERDVIYLSVTYGKQADGKLRYNFGPLNRENGWRRLNVLVSRARKQMTVFSSLRAADINPTAVATQGPALLADFLRYAETGKLMANSTGGAIESESPFESELGAALEDMGFMVDRQVGVGAYRIDLGVRHRDKPGIYLAGIECDGAAYHAAPCARDRDRLRQHVLEQRGWTIIRVWSTDWFRDRSRTLERLRRTLDTLRERSMDDGGTKPRLAVVAESEDELREPTTETKSRNGRQAEKQYARPEFPAYEKASPANRYLGSLTNASATEVAREAARIVAEEGPIHHDELVNRLLEFWSHERRGSRLVAAADHGIRYAIRRGLVGSRESFLFTAAQTIRPRNRAGLDQGAEWVSVDELAEAARQILARADAISEDRLAIELREVLGLQRSQAGGERIKQAIQRLIDCGDAAYSVAGLRLRETKA